MARHATVQNPRRRPIRLAAAVLIGLSLMGSYSKCDGLSTPSTDSAGSPKVPQPEADPKCHTDPCEPSPEPKKFPFKLTGITIPQRSVYWTFRCGDKEDDQLEIRVGQWTIDCEASPGDIIRLKIVSPKAGFNYCAITYAPNPGGREYVRDQNSLLKAGQCVVAWQVSEHEDLNHKGLIPLPEPS